MTDTTGEFIDVSSLRIGHYVYIDLGWMAHPFPLNNFKIQSQQQIDIIRSLGLRQLRYSPEKSDPAAKSPAIAGAIREAAPAAKSRTDVDESAEFESLQRRREALAAQQANLLACERKFIRAAKVYREVSDAVHAKPDAAREQSETLIRDILGDLLAQEESSIRLLSEAVGERASVHSVNVSVISLLLGRACNLAPSEMHVLGVGALLHDVGKIDLPDRLRWPNHKLTPTEQLAYQEHVKFGLAIGKTMGLGKEVLQVIAQHHEYVDGQGYPHMLSGERLSAPARIVALVNYYDNLCNPPNPAFAVTPHEALSLMFAQVKSHFDASALASFIRMMGVYPPGSVVQLTDERFALVVSVSASRPLKPRVLIHEAGLRREEALLVNLEDVAELGIRRSLKLLQLPKNVADFLSPRDRICYYFERARSAGTNGELV